MGKVGAALGCAVAWTAYAAGALAAPAIDGTLLLESDTAWRVYSPRVAQKSQNRIELDIEARLGAGWRVRGLGRLLYDPVGRLVGRDPDLGQEPVDRWQVGGSSDLEAELRELYAHWTGRLRGARMDVRLGKQQVVWGQSFGLRVLDMINAQDFREFILDDFVDARTPVWGARLDAAVSGWSLQGLWFPDFEPDVLADPESEFALDPQLEGLLPPLISPTGALPAVAFADADSPSDGDPSAWGFGFRAARVVGEWDLALHYWDRRDPRGVFERSLTSLRAEDGRAVPVNRFERRFPRVRTLGFSFSTAVGELALWGEGGLSFGRRFVTNDLTDADGAVTRPELQYALGLDWVVGNYLFANFQLIQFVILDHEGAIDSPAHREFLSVLFRFDLLGERLFPQLFVLYGVQKNESMIRPSIEWRATDRLSVTVGADLFTGPRDGLLGQFDTSRECVPVQAGLPLPGSGGCLFEPPPGRPSRAFIRFRYEFGFHR
jgi:hypothetical protein